jgi:hypothetical protein
MNRRQFSRVAPGIPTLFRDDAEAANLGASLLSKMDFAMLTVLACSEDGAGGFKDRLDAMPTAVTRPVLP